MKFFALAGLIAATQATDVAVGGECKKPAAAADGTQAARPVCAGSAATPPTACCGSGKADGAADDTIQERCATIAAAGAAQTVTAVTTPAVLAVTVQLINTCSPSGEVGGNNVAGNCVVCDAGG